MRERETTPRSLPHHHPSLFRFEREKRSHRRRAKNQKKDGTVANHRVVRRRRGFLTSDGSSQRHCLFKASFFVYTNNTQKTRSKQKTPKLDRGAKTFFV
jgi:hypothetical protein